MLKDFILIKMIYNIHKMAEREENLKLQNLSKDNKLLKSEPEVQQSKPKQFRPINDYKPKGDFLYNSNISKNKEFSKPRKKNCF